MSDTANAPSADRRDIRLSRKRSDFSTTPCLPRYWRAIIASNHLTVGAVCDNSTAGETKTGHRGANDCDRSDVTFSCHKRNVISAIVVWLSTNKIAGVSWLLRRRFCRIYGLFGG